MIRTPWSSDRRLISIAGRTLTLLLVVAGIADPQLQSRDDEVPMTVLLDVSDSMSDEVLQRSWQLLRQQLPAPDKTAGVEIAQFAEATRTLGADPGPGRLERSPDLAGDSTDIERAMRYAYRRAYSDTRHLTLLVSDGMANRGDLDRALAAYRPAGHALIWWEPASRSVNTTELDFTVDFPSRTQAGAEVSIPIHMRASTAIVLPRNEQQA